MKLLFKNIILAFLFIILLGFHAFADVEASISTGTQWLISQQNHDGSFGTNFETIPLDTVEAINALKIQPNTELEVSNALNFLNSYTPLEQDYIARIALVTNNSLYIQSLVENQNEDGGWGLLSGFASDPLDTTLALQALRAVNYDDLETISYALGYLTRSQNEDGGWGFYEGDESNVYMTAMVLKVFSSYSLTFDVQSSMNDAVGYLLTKQNTDGGFGSSPSTVYETALAFEALVASGADISATAQPAIDYFLTSQQTNGSWNNDPYSTALAIRALTNVKPNLKVSSEDITFSNPTPIQGETITISSAIHNTGPVRAEDVLVQFYDGDPDARRSTDWS